MGKRENALPDPITPEEIREFLASWTLQIGAPQFGVDYQRAEPRDYSDCEIEGRIDLVRFAEWLNERAGLKRQRTADGNADLREVEV